jgi:Tfp pilus tip-associated adhesin PilY1
MIGFALPTGTNPTSLDIIAAAGGTGTAFLADDPASLQAAFDSIFLDILAKTGASSSAATNSTSLSTNSFIYQARFNSGDWNGQLLAKSISLSGVIDPVLGEQSQSCKFLRHQYVAMRQQQQHHLMRLGYCLLLGLKRLLKVIHRSIKQ